MLGGRIGGGTIHIERVLPLPNQSMHDDAFTVEGSQFARCEHELRESGFAFVGFAHSHPGGHASPSQRDREQLWTDCVQVITNGEQVCAFVLDRNRVAHPVRQVLAPAAPIAASGAPR